MIKAINLTSGEKYTIYSLSGMASTRRVEITVTSILDTPEYRKAFVSDTPSVHGNWRLGAYRPNRKRKQYHLDICAGKDLIIPGWGHLQTDSEAYNSFSMNACMNFAGTPEQVRKLVDKNINQHFSNYDILLAYPMPQDQLPDHDGLMVYPDHPTTHAVVQRTRENLDARSNLSEERGGYVCA